MAVTGMKPEAPASTPSPKKPHYGRWAVMVLVVIGAAILALSLQVAANRPAAINTNPLGDSPDTAPYSAPEPSTPAGAAATVWPAGCPPTTGTTVIAVVRQLAADYNHSLETDDEACWGNIVVDQRLADFTGNALSGPVPTGRIIPEVPGDSTPTDGEAVLVNFEDNVGGGLTYWNVNLHWEGDHWAMAGNIG